MRSLPDHVASNYRTGKNANEWYCYNFAGVPSSNNQAITIAGDHYFLVKKIHLAGFVGPNLQAVPSDFKARLYNFKHGRFHQNIQLYNGTLGGNCSSPNILPAPILLHPASVMLLEMDSKPSYLRWTLEGEKVYDPDPRWVQKMDSRFWYQFAVAIPTATPNQTTVLSVKDPNYDFAVCRSLSWSISQHIINNNNPGFIRIRDKGPQGAAWTNDEVLENNFGGAFAFAAGPQTFQPPIIIPGTSELEIITRGLHTGDAFYDLILDGIKYPRGTQLEAWL